MSLQIIGGKYLVHYYSYCGSLKPRNLNRAKDNLAEEWDQMCTRHFTVTGRVDLVYKFGRFRLAMELRSDFLVTWFLLEVLNCANKGFQRLSFFHKGSFFNNIHFEYSSVCTYGMLHYSCLARRNFHVCTHWYLCHTVSL